MCEIDFQNLFSSNEIKLKLQQINKILDVNAFRTVKTKFGESYLCYSNKVQRIFFANSQLKGYISKIKPDLKVDDGYFYKDNDLTKIVEFKIKAINEVNGQVELEIIKQKRNVNQTESEILPLSDSEKEVKNVNVKSSEQPVKVLKNKVIEKISEEINNEVTKSVSKKK